MADDNHLGVDLATEFSHEEVADRIREYLGASRSSDVNIDAITEIVRGFFRLEGSEERRATLDALAAFFCTHCGSGYLPCYCMRDD